MNLFISFSYLLSALDANLVSQEDLDTGLFAFSARRDLVVDMPEDGIAISAGCFGIYQNERYTQRVALWRDRVVPAVLKAEHDNRIIWRLPGETSMPYERLYDLLTSHDLLMPPECIEYFPGLSAIKRTLEPLNPGLTVVCA